MLLRWLLPIVAVFALLGNAVTSFAAAGTFGDSTCCCPDPTACKCHDHDHPKPDAQLKRCAGDAHKVTPHLQTVVVPETFETAALMSEHTLEYVAQILADQFIAQPETPPF